MKILIVSTGGTIASKLDGSICLDEPLKVLKYVKCDSVEFDCVSPFTVFSEDMNIELWQGLIDCIAQTDFSKYSGVIVLHGSDTLAYTGAILGNAFYDKRVVLVASDKPLEDKSANGVKNFEMAVEHIKSGKDGVFISFNGIFPALEAVSPNDKDELLHAGKSGDRISSPRLLNKNILVITPYPSINYSSYCLDGVDEVLHTMYHSATAPKQVLDFIKRCESRGVKFSFVTTKSSADYETALQFKNIIFNSTLENAYARALYTTLTDSGDDHEE